MSKIIDWILSLMRLVDIEEEQEEPEQEEDSRVFFKVVKSYEECKLVIDNYQMGSVCIYRLDSTQNTDAQGKMYYICGGLYALGGEVSTVGENVFMATKREDADYLAKNYSMGASSEEAAKR